MSVAYVSGVWTTGFLRDRRGHTLPMVEQAEKKDGSFATVLLAGGANLAIAVAKIVAGALTGSSAMLAEGRTRSRTPSTSCSC